MDTRVNTKFKIKDHSENIRRGEYPPVTDTDWERYHFREIKKARCREKIAHHTRNVVLQSFVSLFFVSAGLHYAQKRSVVVPLAAAPSAACSLSKLATHETKRRRYKEVLNKLERS